MTCSSTSTVALPFGCYILGMISPFILSPCTAVARRRTQGTYSSITLCCTGVPVLLWFESVRGPNTLLWHAHVVCTTKRPAALFLSVAKAPGWCIVSNLPKGYVPASCRDPVQCPRGWAASQPNAPTMYPNPTLQGVSLYPTRLRQVQSNVCRAICVLPRPT